ncbi:MAG: hypothetical protein ACOX25_12075 [Caldicoprobacterales bacterium]|jgi:hypothetical protein
MEEKHNNDVNTHAVAGFILSQMQDKSVVYRDLSGLADFYLKEQINSEIKGILAEILKLYPDKDI